MGMNYMDTVIKAGVDIDYFHSQVNILIGGGKAIINIEDSQDVVLNALDTKSGIDAMQVCADGQLRTFAVRVQNGDKAWDSFTIRYSRTSGYQTEYQKRIDAINNFKLYPQYTIQAYVYQGKILSIGAIRTFDLFDQIKYSPNIVTERPNYEDGTIFKVVFWRDLESVSFYRPKEITLFNFEVA